MYITTLKMKFIPNPRLEFFEKKSSRFIIVIIYIYIIYLIGLNLCPTLCLILCPIFLILKNVKSLIYKVMNSLNTLDFVSDFVSHFVSHFVSDKNRREISKTDTQQHKPLNTNQLPIFNIKICNIMNNISVFKNAEHQGYILIAYRETSFIAIITLSSCLFWHKHFVHGQCRTASNVNLFPSKKTVFVSSDIKSE